MKMLYSEIFPWNSDDELWFWDSNIWDSWLRNSMMWFFLRSSVRISWKSLRKLCIDENEFILLRSMFFIFERWYFFDIEIFEDFWSWGLFEIHHWYYRPLLGVFFLRDIIVMNDKLCVGNSRSIRSRCEFRKL